MLRRLLLIGTLTLIFESLPAFGIAFTNGSFSSGNSGFTTDYGYILPSYDPHSGPPSMVEASYYTVTKYNNLNYVNYNWTNLSSDHTGDDAGNVMVVNGSDVTTGAGSLVWQANLPSSLTVGLTYYFVAWIASISNTQGEVLAPAQLHFYADGSPIAYLDAPSTANTWALVYAPFVAQSTDPTFQLVNSRAVWNGNDFALDDMSVESSNPTAPEPGTWALLASGLAAVVISRRKRWA